jgi:hypothetical protein
MVYDYKVTVRNNAGHFYICPIFLRSLIIRKWKWLPPEFQPIQEHDLKLVIIWQAYVIVLRDCGYK